MPKNTFETDCSSEVSGQRFYNHLRHRNFLKSVTTHMLKIHYRSQKLVMHLIHYDRNKIIANEFVIFPKHSNTIAQIYSAPKKISVETPMDCANQCLKNKYVE
jgi:hypothetical protein